jgi:hypothetical protein
MSMSGIVTRSGLRKRSNGSPYSSGSTGVIPSVYVTMEPGALPRQVVMISCSRAKRVKSATMRKYPEYPIRSMIPSS